jgi:DNA-binding transcriptional ArsR family regulator
MGMYNRDVARACTTSDPFNAIAEPRRRHILEFIAAEERSVTEIADALELGQPSVSKHLQVLRDVGLVRVRRDGRHTMYRTNADALRTIHEWSGRFAQYWRGQLRRIKAHAEGEE